MKKKLLPVLVVLLAALIAGGVYYWTRLSKSSTDIIGVTTLTKKNTVIMNSASGDEFVSGTGRITVGEGEHIHLTYKLKGGSFDIGFAPGADNTDEALKNLDMTELEAPGDAPSAYAMEKTGVEGNGEEDFEAESGEYTVYFTMHGAVGTASVTTAGK